MNILTVKQLKKHCRDKGIKGYSKLNKDQLINLCNITKNESKTQTNIKSSSFNLNLYSKKSILNFKKFILDFLKDKNNIWLYLQSDKISDLHNINIKLKYKN